MTGERSRMREILLKPCRCYGTDSNTQAFPKQMMPIRSSMVKHSMVLISFIEFSYLIFTSYLVQA